MRGLIFLFSISISIICYSQQEIQNKAYAATINLLLDHSVPEISIEAAAKNKEVIFLDTRSKKEFETSHIKNALWVGYENFNVSTLPSNSKNKTFILYCSVGYRSEKITEKLISAGYSKCYNLYGGIFEWVNTGHPVYKNSTRTNNVHAYDKAWGIWLEKGQAVY